MKTPAAALGAAFALAFPTLAQAEEADAPDRPTIVVTGERPDPATAPDSAPGTRATVTAADIAEKINALSVEDTIRYLPGLVVRKRHIGDTFAPIATRTSGLGASARSLIFADGMLLSALIANNNGNGSPRWNMVAPEEIARIDVLYGPFAAEYAGNSIGTVVNITTRLPDKLEARASVTANVQTFDLYATHRTLPAWQYAGSLGGRAGPLALFASATRTVANSQPVSLITAAAAPGGSTGAFDGLTRTGSSIKVLGAGGLEHHVQDTLKLKAALDLSAGLRLTYVVGLWRDDTRGGVETYLQTGAGAITYATAGSGATTGFNSAVYGRDARHLGHALSLIGKGTRFDWQIIGTIYDYARDWQTNPSPDAATATSASTGFVATRNDLPGAFAGGAGTIQKQDGTGWVTIDAKGTARPNANDSLVVSFGVHADREKLSAATYSIANWLDPRSALGQLRSRSYGKTRTLALWGQGELQVAPALRLTLGARQEWWRAFGGLNTALTATVKNTLVQPERDFSGFSPKATIAWQGGSGLSVRLSAGQAWRMPTVGELYQSTTVGTLLSNPNPTLLPERARSLELAVEKRDDRGSLRLSLFNELVDDALISQLNAATNTTYIQNVDRTRARGVELAFDRRDVIPGIDLSASLTYADAKTVKDTANPAAMGKLLPSVPRWKGTAVLTWRPGPKVSLTAAMRFASRNWGTLENTDIVGNTYQGFYKYTVFDLRAQFRPTDRLTLSVGIDNLTNDKYFLFHPFPQRSLTVQAGWKL